MSTYSSEMTCLDIPNSTSSTEQPQPDPYLHSLLACFSHHPLPSISSLQPFLTHIHLPLSAKATVPKLYRASKTQRNCYSHDVERVHRRRPSPRPLPPSTKYLRFADPGLHPRKAFSLLPLRADFRRMDPPPRLSHPRTNTRTRQKGSRRTPFPRAFH